MSKQRQYNTTFSLSEMAKDFFTLIGQNEALQKRLYQTRNLVEVSNIALEYNLKVSPQEILKAQAGRVLAIIDEKNQKDIQILLDGGKPESGAQWGRGGNGYLDNAGHWLVYLLQNAPHHNSDLLSQLFQAILSNSLFEAELIESRTFRQVAQCCNHFNLTVDPIDLLVYQCQSIIELDDEIALKMAS